MPEESFHPLTYKDRSEAQNFELWSKFAPSNQTAYQLTMKHFGSVSGKSVIDFGCGNGLFLKRCLDNGASKVVGLDKSPFMIESARENFPDLMNQSTFIVHDCSKPFNDKENLFDLACSHYALQNSSTIEEFETYLLNMYNSLKEGGMAVICMPRMAKNKSEQKYGAELFGFRLPLAKDFVGPEPIRWTLDFLVPDVQNGRGFLNESWSTVTEYSWSEEILLKTMYKVGFTDVESLDPKLTLSNRKNGHMGTRKKFSCCALFAIGKK